MSWWGTLEAAFKASNLVTVTSVMHGVPTGSESGPKAELLGTEGPVVFREYPEVHVTGRLRDVSDYNSPAVLAWFLQAARYAEWATLVWDVDSGPRYRYEWRDNQLTKLKGVLDL